MGEINGFQYKDIFCFGNLNLSILMAGTIVLTNYNCYTTRLLTELKGRNEPGVVDLEMAIGSGLSLLGNGYYYGSKRLYGVGFNKLTITAVGVGAATVTGDVLFNGYLFKMK